MLKHSSTRITPLAHSSPALGILQLAITASDVAAGWPGRISGPRTPSQTTSNTPPPSEATTGRAQADASITEPLVERVPDRSLLGQDVPLLGQDVQSPHAGRAASGQRPAPGSRNSGDGVHDSNGARGWRRPLAALIADPRSSERRETGIYVQLFQAPYGRAHFQARSEDDHLSSTCSEEAAFARVGRRWVWCPDLKRVDNGKNLHYMVPYPQAREFELPASRTFGPMSRFSERRRQKCE